MINIKETFLTLTARRYPMGTEDLAMDIVKKLMPNVKFEKDQFSNYFVYIPKVDGTDSDTMFVSHLDTINSSPFGYNYGKKWDVDLKKYVDDTDAEVDDMSIKHVIDGDIIKTDGNTNLGADDKAGTVIMMNMISENVPGLYYFFMGEECGCVGSSSLSRVLGDQGHPKMNKCISFDRRGFDSIITEQSGICASDEFALELAKRFEEYGFWFAPDPTGVYTDSAEFTDIISECTNLSVGYSGEHTKSEKQDIEFLVLLGITCTQIDWETLPIVRDVDKIYTGKKSKKTYNNYNHNKWNEWDDYDDDDFTSNKFNNSNKQSKTYIDDIDDIKEFKSKTSTDFDFDAWYESQKKDTWEQKETV